MSNITEQEIIPENEPVALEKLKQKPKPVSPAERIKQLSAEQLEQLQQFMNELEKK